MLKILKNLKQSWLSVLVIIALLCLQAATDLELPNYTSKIVNDGIQAGGIEDSVPETITEEDMNSLLLFTTDDEFILNNYELVDSEKYELKDISNSEREELSNKMLDPIIIFGTVQTEEILKSLPEEQLSQILSESEKQIDQMQETIKEQTAILYIKQIYTNAGVDLDDLQMSYIFTTGLKMLGLAAVSMASGITIMMLSSRVGAKMAKTLREKIFKKVYIKSTKNLYLYE